MENNFFKNILKNSVVQMITALTAVGVISGVTLVFVYVYAMPKIEVNIKNATDQAIKDIFPDASTIESADEKNIYEVKGAGGSLIGYAFLAQGNGYQGTIKLIVGVNPEITSQKGMEVLESQETPGLGAEIMSKKFKDQFVDLPLVHAIEYVKNQKPEKDYEIEAITGATISSRAVVNILNKRISEIRKLLKG